MVKWAVVGKRWKTEEKSERDAESERDGGREREGRKKRGEKERENKERGIKRDMERTERNGKRQRNEQVPLNTPRQTARFCSAENTLRPLALLYISKQIGWSDLSRGIADSDKKDGTTNQLFLDPLFVQAVRHDATPANVESSELKIPRHRVRRRRRF